MLIFFKLREAILASPAKRDKIILANLIFSLMVNIAIWVALIFSFQHSDEYIISYYNIYFGISAVSSWYILLLIPLVGLAVIAINFLLSFYFYLKEQLLSYFLSFVFTVVNLILLVATGLIIYINL